jgi:hypothetical protein
MEMLDEGTDREVRGVALPGVPEVPPHVIAVQLGGWDALGPVAASPEHGGDQVLVKTRQPAKKDGHGVALGGEERTFFGSRVLAWRGRAGARRDALRGHDIPASKSIASVETTGCLRRPRGFGTWRVNGRAARGFSR